MTVKEFRENYPEHQLQTTLRHYKPQETLDKFLDNAEKQAIHNAINNLK